MKLTLKELRGIVDEVVSEAKKKKEKAEKNEKVPEPREYQYAEALDFSSPLGAYNLYKSQGAVNWGPMTGPGPKVDDRVHVSAEAKSLKEFLQKALAEGQIAGDSEWRRLAETIAPPVKFDSVWGAALHWHSLSSKRKG